MWAFIQGKEGRGHWTVSGAAGTEGAACQGACRTPCTRLSAPGSWATRCLVILVLPAWSASVLGNAAEGTGSLCVCLCLCACACVHVCVHTCAGTIAVSDRLGWVTSTMNDTVLDNKPECLSQARATILASEPSEVQDPELPQELWMIPWGWRWRTQGGNLKPWHPALPWHTILLRKWEHLWSSGWTEPGPGCTGQKWGRMAPWKAAVAPWSHPLA